MFAQNTPVEFHRRLVELASEAFDRATNASSFVDGEHAAARGRFVAAAVERMAQAASVYAMECSDRAKRIDENARAALTGIVAADSSTDWSFAAEDAYTYATALERAREPALRAALALGEGAAP